MNESINALVSKKYPIEEIIKEFVTDDFTVIHHSFNHYKIIPCPFSGSERGLSFYERSNGEDEFYRHSIKNIDKRYANVLPRGTAFDLLAGLFPDENPMQLMQKLVDSDVPKMLGTEK